MWLGSLGYLGLYLMGLGSSLGLTVSPRFEANIWIKCPKQNRVELRHPVRIPDTEAGFIKCLIDGSRKRVVPLDPGDSYPKELWVMDYLISVAMLH
jgi:hypothetical protein